jgi:hypothetical protein
MLAHIHKVKIVICVQPVDIIRIASVKLVKRAARLLIVLQFILENHSHIIQSLLHNVVASEYLLLSTRYIFQIIFRIGRIRLGLQQFLIFLRYTVVGLGKPLFILIVAGILVETESILIAAPPVILQFTRAPPALELGLTGRLGLRIVKIPRFVTVQGEIRRSAAAGIIDFTF